MASLAIASVVIAAAGTAISAIAQANALRGQARARQVEGEQELLSSRRQLRQELGQAAVDVGASGLLGSSFANVFESQAIEDAEFLGRIKQRTDFDVASLKRQATITLVTGLISAGAGAAGGIAQARTDKATLEAAERATARQATQRAAARKRFGNIFGSSGPRSSAFRIPTTATFF
jgi:hypothetical protein